MKWKCLLSNAIYLWKSRFGWQLNLVLFALAFHNENSNCVLSLKLPEDKTNKTSSIKSVVVRILWQTLLCNLILCRSSGVSNNLFIQDTFRRNTAEYKLETVSQHENITLKTLDTSDMYFECYESCYQPIDDYSIFVVEAGWSWFLFVLSVCQECATLELSFQRQEIRSLISRSQHFSTPPSWVSEDREWRYFLGRRKRR